MRPSLPADCGLAISARRCSRYDRELKARLALLRDELSTTFGLLTCTLNSAFGPPRSLLSRPDAISDRARPSSACHPAQPRMSDRKAGIPHSAQCGAVRGHAGGHRVSGIGEEPAVQHVAKERLLSPKSRRTGSHPLPVVQLRDTWPWKRSACKRPRRRHSVGYSKTSVEEKSGGQVTYPSSRCVNSHASHGWTSRPIDPISGRTLDVRRRDDLWRRTDTNR